MKRTIVIAEDERIAAEDLKATIEEIGYDVISIVSTGEEAIEIAADKKPDLFFMDIMLSGMIDGIEAARKITQDHNIPVIFCTAYNDPATIREAATVDAFDFINKPFHRDMVKHSLEHFFS